ncbi:hypothetical protein CR513_05191, partial [Mucuna pruriens]
MEHLSINFPSEIRMGGLVQYHWMYPFESVEKYVCEAYLLQETSYFSSHYFVPPIGVCEEVHQDHIQPTLSIFWTNN